MIRFVHDYAATGLPTDYYMDAQSEPVILSFDNDVLCIRIECWEEDEKDPVGVTEADYHLRIMFCGVIGYRLMFSEWVPYRLDYGNHIYPPFIFEVDFSSEKRNIYIGSTDDDRQPNVKKQFDPIGWFGKADKWRPWKKKIKAPTAIKKFLVRGHDSYLEILAKEFSVQKELNS